MQSCYWILNQHLYLVPAFVPVPVTKNIKASAGLNVGFVVGLEVVGSVVGLEVVPSPINLV